MLKLIKGVMFKFDVNKKLTHEMWEAYESVFRFRQQKFGTNQDFFERFKNSTSVLTEYDGSIAQDMGLVNHRGSKEDVQGEFLAVGLVQKSDEVRYSELRIYMHNNYVNVKEHFPKRLPAALNIILIGNCGRGLLYSSMNP